MKILICPDSFKGSLTSKEVCECIKTGIKKTGTKNEISTLPLSDGGEGFCECVKDICKGNELYENTFDIYMKPIVTSYITLQDTAIIECSKASGLQKRKAVMNATSYGTGILIKSALSLGFKNIILALGGTGCCDGGVGILSALGAEFLDENYKEISPVRGGDLNYIFGAKFKNIVKDINFTYACDVNNVYFGEDGAAFVFAPQKGANKTQVKELDEGLKRLNAFLPRDISKVQGSGAAGGICGGLYSVYGGEIKSGFDILSELTHLEEKIKKADLIITGEGKSDRQSLMGKLPYRIASLAKKYNKKCVVISGSIEDVSFGNKMISLTDDKTNEKEAIENARNILIEKSKYVLQ